MKTLQKFAAVHGTVHNYFNQERHVAASKRRWITARFDVIGLVGIFRSWRPAFGDRYRCAAERGLISAATLLASRPAVCLPGNVSVSTRHPEPLMPT